MSGRVASVRIMRRPEKFVPAQLHPEARPVWHRLLNEQHGVVSIAQLREVGVTRYAAEASVDADRWQHVLPRVYATFTGPLPRSALISAALLYAGPAAVISHRTAAEEWGMLLHASGPIHVTVPYGCSAISQPPWLVVHRSRAFAHIAVNAALPLVGRADTAVDLAVAEPTARLAMRRLVALATTSRISSEDLRRRIEERRPRRYRTAINNAVRLMASGVSSPLEELFAVDVEQAHALPAAIRQVPFTVDGRTLWEDATYDHVGVVLTVRLDGQRYHERADVAFRDRRRDNAAELAGRHRLVYGWKDLAADPCGAAGEVAAVLRRCGWAGPLRRCTRCG
jgi:hypothetical protein